MRVLLATIGSLGDLHPFLALALALRERGVEPVLAVPADHLTKCMAQGVEAVALTPTFAEIGGATGLDEATVLQRVLASGDFLVSSILLPTLEQGVERLVEAGRGASAVVGSSFTFAAPIAAEVLGVPFVAARLQPFARFAADDPPIGPLPLFAPPSSGRAGAAWNRTLLRGGKWFARRRYGSAINRVRAAHALPPTSAAPMMEPVGRAAMTLDLFSPSYAPSPDAVGFPWFDRDEAPRGPDHELEAFLESGPAPVVVSLGSFVPHAAGDVYPRIADALARAGHRALLLTGSASVAEAPGRIVRDYLPHSAVFSRASVILHHGGIGTTGQALASGRPQLVLPFMGDQFDQAARITRLGVGQRLARRRLEQELPAALERVQRPAIRAAAARLGATISREDGAGKAADAIIAAATGA
nr:glycosyltransferase [uncultured Sphingomonas sp.]